MQQRGPIFLFAVAFGSLCASCASTPRPSDTTPVAQLMPPRLFVAVADTPEPTYHDFDVPEAGAAWLIARASPGTNYEVTVNGRAVRPRGAEPTRIGVTRGRNRLGVRVRGSPPALVEIGVVAVADRVELAPSTGAKASEEAPVSAGVLVTALGRPVANADVAVHLLAPRARLRLPRTPVELRPREPPLTGVVDNGTVFTRTDGVIARRIVRTDGVGRADVSLPGLKVGQGRLEIGVAGTELVAGIAVAVPDITLTSPVPSTRVPVDARRSVPITVGLQGLSVRGRTVEIDYAISPRGRGAPTVNGPRRVPFDRSKLFPLTVVVAGARAGDYTLTITARDSSSNRSATLSVPVRVEPDESAPRLFVPIAQPPGLPLGSDSTRVRFLARVAEPAAEALTLQEVDANGKVLRDVARLLDNGREPDEVANDFLYSGTAALDGSRQGERYYRVAAQGPRGTVVSGPRPFLVTRFSLDFPPPNPDELVDLTPGGPRVFRNRVVVFVEPELAGSDERVERLARSINGAVLGVSPPIRQYQMRFEGPPTGSAVLEVIARLRGQAGVRAAYPDFEVRPATEPGEASTIAGCVDETSPCQWHVERVNGRAAWAQASGIVPATPIGLFEPSGVAGTHSDLGANCVPANGATPCDQGSHGTNVAGVLAGVGNNGGIAGIAWESPFHVYRNAGNPSLFNASLAAATQPVLNVSLDVGSAIDFITVRDALIASGELLVAAAGNVGETSGICNSDVAKYPAMHNADLNLAGQILAVGATDSSDQLADWGTSCSNRASWVDVYAPGRGIYTTNQGGGYDHVHGTSVATPIVSGAAALLWSLHPGWSANEVHDKILGRSAVLSAPGVLNGQKRLDVYATLGVPTLALSNASPTIQSDCSDGNAFTVAGGSDPDLSNPIIAWDSTDTLSYAFDDGSGNASLTSGPFEIDAVNGQISARAAACPLDPLASPHNLLVRVGDSLGMTATAPVTVSVQQVVSNVPNFGGVIDFETPAMGPMEERRGLDPLAAGAGALSFVVHDEFGFPDAVVGLVRNRATSACFEPSSANQTLGTGRDMSGTTDHIGLSGFPIRAIFSPPLQPNSGEQVRIGAQFQSGTGVAVRIRLFDAADNQVGTAQSTLSLTEGTCGYPGPQRAHATITATASTPVAYAVFDVPTNVPSGGRVFTIDSVDISVAP